MYKIWSRVPVNYYQIGVKNNFLQRTWHGEKIQNAKKMIEQLDFSNCLDVGCASGYMISMLAKDFPDKKFYGIDAYDRAIAFAKKKYRNISFKVASAESLPFKNNFFDLVICYETIEHANKPEMLLMEIKRVLRRNGILILAMDSGNFLFRIVWNIWEKTKGRVWSGAHLHPFHHDELEKLIIKSGLKIQKKVFTHFRMEVVFILQK